MRIREAMLLATAETGAMRDRNWSPATGKCALKTIGGGRQ
jgi:hypothetical protein